MDLAYGLARSLLFALDAERAHDLVLSHGEFLSRHSALLSIVRRIRRPEIDPCLTTEVFGLLFESPLGLAAGLDKNGVAIDLWSALGFGFVEVGTVTPGHGQPGNDKPRLHRAVRDRAIVNRMGFNNRGAEALAERLKARRSPIVVGANLGKAKLTPPEGAAGDYVASLRAVAEHSDYLAINVSSPNTPGLRDLQAVSVLGPLLSTVLDENRRVAAGLGRRPRPVLLKIAPDLADQDVDAIADLAVEVGLDGLIATNTTIERKLLSSPPPIEGGVSGPPLRPRALELTRRLYRRLGGRLPIVGVGGIGSAEDAYERIRAGASLVQVYTAFIYEGPGLLAGILGGLPRLLARDGFSSVAEAVGVDARS